MNLRGWYGEKKSSWDDIPPLDGLEVDWEVRTGKSSGNEGRRACPVAMHPDDIQALGLQDGRQVRVTTEAGSEVGELAADGGVRRGTVLIPHGFGLIYEGKVYGINVNRLTKSSHRDFLGTPLHRFVPCRVEAE